MGEDFLDKAKGLSGGRRVGGSGGAPGTPDVSKILKKSMKNNNFRPIFENFIDFFDNLWKNLENYRNMDFPTKKVHGGIGTTIEESEFHYENDSGNKIPLRFP